MRLKTLTAVFLCAAPFAGAQAVQFKGAVSCPIRNAVEQVVAPTGSGINLQDETCYWSGAEFAGQALKQQRLLSVGITVGKGCFKANGYDIGTLANNDHWQGEWHEEGCEAKGGKIEWRIVAGTGVIKGIKGSGTITCGNPPQTAAVSVNGQATPVQELVLTCDVSGSYTLPKAQPSAANK